MVKAPDHSARTRALDCTSSFAVSAPAGSGKTELLIQRTLKLLSQADSPESVLAITFTRKAAAEMRERLVQALTAAKSNTPVEGAHQQLTRDLATAALNRDNAQEWQLIENPGRLQIHTIDAFCRQIASQLCLDTGISLPPNVAEKPAQLYLNAAEALLEHLDQESSAGENLRTVCNQFDGNVGEVAQLFADMLASRDSWLPLAYNNQITQQDYLSEVLSQVTEDRLERLNQCLQPFASDIESLLDYALQNAETSPGTAKYLSPDLAPDFPLPNADSLAQWKALVAFLCTKSAEKFRSSVNVQSGFPAEKQSDNPALAKTQKAAFKELVGTLNSVEGILPTMQLVDVLPRPEQDQQHSLQSKALLQLLPVLAAEFSLQVQSNGETDYADIAMTALRALRRDGRPTSLALRLDYQIDHILVDEFQDTANLQVQLLECLTDGWEPEDGRTLFIVGDGMQSIYGFRKANVSLFVRARQQGIGEVPLEPLDLTANFRSDAPIVDWVNNTFSSIFKAEDNLPLGQVGFRHADSTRGNPENPAQVIDVKGFNSHEAEADAIAQDISERLKTSNGTVALLVRSRPHLKQILPALRSQGVQWQAQKIDRLSDRMAVIDIHSLTRAICIPADRIAWLATLRAPWAGLSNADLLHLCQWHREGLDSDSKKQKLENQSLWDAICHICKAESSTRSINQNISPDGQQILARLQALFEIAFAQLGNASLRALIEELWRNLDGPATLAGKEDEQDISDYLNLLEANETAGAITNWAEFEDKLTDLFAQPRSMQPNVPESSNQSQNMLQIMTIHNAKGLEFDHVYIAGLSRTPRNEDNPLLLYAEPENEDGVLGYLVSAKPAADREDELYQYLKTERNRRAEEEVARLLYVGCTRAKQTLRLSCRLKLDDSGQVSAPGARTLAKYLWPVTKDAFSEGVLPIEDDSDNEVLRLETLRRLPVDRPNGAIGNSQKGEDSADEVEATSSINVLNTFATNVRQRVVGNLLHETLMEIVQSEDKNPDPKYFERHWKRLLIAQGYQAETQADLLHQLSDSLQNMLSNDTGRWILSPDHTHSHAELPMDYLDQQGTLQRSVIDRTFVDQGIRWIIDYKSSAPQQGEPVDAFLARESATYQPQLLHYSKLFNDEYPIKAMLYFPAVGCHTELAI